MTRSGMTSSDDAAELRELFAQVECADCGGRHLQLRGADPTRSGSGLPLVPPRRRLTPPIVTLGSAAADCLALRDQMQALARALMRRAELRGKEIILRARVDTAGLVVLVYDVQKSPDRPIVLPE
jgi:hypothetical protein